MIYASSCIKAEISDRSTHIIVRKDQYCKIDLSLAELQEKKINCDYIHSLHIDTKKNVLRVSAIARENVFSGDPLIAVLEHVSFDHDVFGLYNKRTYPVPKKKEAIEATRLKKLGA